MEKLNRYMPSNLTAAVADHLICNGAIDLPEAQGLGVDNQMDLANIVHRLRKLHGMKAVCADRRTKKFRGKPYVTYVLTTDD